MFCIECGHDGNGTPHDVVNADFARQLERELEAHKQDAERLAGLLAESVNHPRIKSAPLAEVSDEWRERIYKALREHEALKTV